MIARRTGLVLAAILVGSCSVDRSSEDVAGGGFETSDLQVSMLDESGAELVGARAWLLGSEAKGADTLEIPLDSGLSDLSGMVRFPRRNFAGARVGLEAWSGDTMVANLPRVSLENRDTITIVLRRARILTLPCAAFPAGTILRMPGSHFEQRPPVTCVETFRVLVPPTAGFVLAFVQRPGPPLHVYFGPDTLPFFRPSGPPPGGNGPPPFGLDSSRSPAPMPMP